MKKLVLCLLVVGSVCLPAISGDTINREFDIMKVPHITNEGITKYRNYLEGHMRVVNTTTHVAYGAGILGAGYLLYRWFGFGSGGVTNQQVALAVGAQGTRIQDLEDERDLLKDRVDVLEANRPNSATLWAPWVSSQLSGVKKVAERWVPSLIQNFAYAQLSHMIYKRLPGVGKYLSVVPSMNWCMFQGTQFSTTLSHYINWYVSLMQSQGREPNLKEFAVCSHQFVQEMEKVIGYMIYVKDQLRPDSQVLLARSEVCIESVIQEMTELVMIINGFLQQDSVTPEYVDHMMEFWQKAVFSIIGQLETFEDVAKAVDFYEEDDPGRFNLLKKFIAPQWNNPVPKPQGESEEDAMMKQMLSIALQEAAA